jgi:tetratricopeptide (TPR) repeat protein
MSRFKILKTFSLFLVFFIFPMDGYAQDHRKEIDSISKLLLNNYAKGDQNPNLTLKHVTSLYYLSKEAKFYQGQVGAIFEEARIYYFNGHFDSALAKISEGIDLTKAKGDDTMLCRFLLVYQKVLLQLDHLSAATQILKEAERYNEKVTSKEDKLINDIYILSSQADLLILNKNLTDIEKIIQLKNQAYSKSLKISNSNYLKKATILYSLESLTASLAHFGKVAEARKFMKIIDQHLSTFPDDAFTIQSLIIKGMIESAAKNPEKAVGYYTQASIKAQKNNNTYKEYEIYAMISASYAEMKDFEKATSFSKKYKHLIDSIDIVKKKSGDVNFINKINQKINSKKTVSDNNLYFIIFLVAAIILVILFFIYKIRRKKKNTEYPPSISDGSVDTPSEVKQNQENLQHNTSENVKELVVLAKEDINAFYIEFQKVYPDFYKTLAEKYPELNISDINFCTLMKMNFGIKEISQYNNSTIRAAEARRYRIIKKMELNNQNELYMILSNIN